MRFGGWTDKAHRQARLPRAPSPADAVNVVHRRARQVVIDDHRQQRHVQAARRHIGRDHHFDVRIFKVEQHLCALALAQFAMKRLGLQAGFAELVGHHLGGVLGGHEDQNTAPFSLRDQVPQQLGATAAVNLNRQLRDGADFQHLGQHFNTRRRLQQAGCQSLYRSGQGGREKQVLPASGQQGQNPLELFVKTEIEQPIGLVQHQRLHCRQVERVVVNQVQQAAGRGHHPVGAAAQTHHLRVDRDPAKDDGDFELGCHLLRQQASHLANLHGQLTRGHQNQRPHPPWPSTRDSRQHLQNRQTKGSRLARTGFSRCQYVAARQNKRNGGRLHRRGLAVVQASQSAKKGRRQAECGKRHAEVILKLN